MPALVAFGRRWLIGTDDFVLPGLLDSTVKSCWLLAAIIIFVQYDSSNMLSNCPGGHFLKIYFYFMITALTLTVLTDISIVNKSMSGHIMDKEVRKLVVPLIYVRLFWEALDICWNIVGSYWVYGGTLGCVETEAPGELAFIKRFIICNWMSVLFLSLFTAYLFDPLGREHLSTKSACTDHIIAEPPETRRSKFWETRCKIWCCFCCDASSPEDELKQSGFHEVGKLLANLVQDYDFLPSDILAGLIALHYKNKAENPSQIVLTEKVSCSPKLGQQSGVKSEVPVIVSQPRPRTSPTIDSSAAAFPSFECRDEIFLLRHYCKYLNGLNGWPGFISVNKNHTRKALRSFWRRLVCCGCLKRVESFEIEGDNCCYCGTAALKEAAVSEKIQEKDIIHISFVNDYYQVPFYLAVDHATKSYVLTLRGTFSGRDIITDLTAWPVPIGIPGLPDTFLAHHGILMTARNAKAKLDTLGLLGNMSSVYPEYKLVLIGQSLGAAVATLLGMLLKPDHPNLKVYAYNPPGGLLNLEASIWSANFTTSVVYGTDIIARLSLISLEKFRSKVIEAIEDCRTPKFKLLLGYCSCFFGIAPKVKFKSKLEDNKGTADVNYIQIEESKEPRAAAIQGQSAKPYVPITTMYLPGRILHVTEINVSSQDDDVESETEPKFEMRWAEREEFLEIIAHPRMYRDHWPFRMLAAFREHLKIEPPEVLQMPGTADANGNDNLGFVPC